MKPFAGGVILISMILFMGFFFLLPLSGTFRMAFMGPQGGWTLDFLFEIFRNPLYVEGLRNALTIAIYSTLGCLCLAVPLALIFVRHEFFGKAQFNGLLLVPLILPPFVGALGIQAMLGQAGALNSLLIDWGVLSWDAPIDWLGRGQLLGVIIMNVLHLYPIVYLNLSGSLANIDPQWDDAANSLGCPPFRRFWRITLPLAMPGLYAGCSIAFIWAFTELGVPLIFDVDRVTSVQIFSAIKDLNNNPLPYALVVVLLGLTLLLFFGSRAFFRSDLAGGEGKATLGRPIIPLTGWRGWLATGFFAAVVAIALLPHIGVLLMALSKDWYETVLPHQWTLEPLERALGHPLTLTAIGNSLRYALLATILDLVLGVAVAWLLVRTKLFGRSLVDGLTMMPLAVPGIVMAFGYLALSRSGQPLDWLIKGEDPLMLLVVAYAMRRLPYVVRSVTAGLQQVHPALEEAAESLGATPIRALWRVTFPLVMPAVLAGGLLAFAFAMLEVSDSMILAQRTIHFPITKAIYTLAAALGDGPSLASALGLWAMLFLTVTFVGTGAILGRKIGALFKV